MKPFRPCLAAVALLFFCAVSPSAVLAQLQTGNLYGTVADEQGSPLPGVTVTLTGQGQPQVQVTNAQGQFRFLGLAPGSYTQKTELEGFSTVDYPNIGINVGRNTSIEVTLSAAVENVITVTDESPVLDERRIATGRTVAQIELEKTPTARDPWVILQQTPGVLMDRVNVGGNEPGQQSQFVGQGGQEVHELGLEDFANMLAGNDLVVPKGGNTYEFDPVAAAALLEEAGWVDTDGDGVREAAGTGRVGISFGNVLGGNPTTGPPAIQDGGMWLFESQHTPGVLTDRINVGGNEAGQQSQYIPPGDQSTWSVDGVVITDTAALGSPPTYYDFDSFEEMQVTTGGNDATIATGGVVLNMVTKRGTNEWRGSGRYTISDEEWDAAQEAWLSGNQTLQQGNRIVSVEDYGAEFGSPIIKDRLWIWGSYGTQETYIDQAGVQQELDWNTIQEIAKTLTVDANGNDANSPAFDPNQIVQFGYGLDCGIPGYNVYGFGPSAPQAGEVCPQIQIQIKNFYGTGALQGLLPDPYAGPTIHVGVGEPPPGRIGSIVSDPSDPSGNTVFSTGTTGGTWKTTNFLTTDPAGPKWVPVTGTTWPQDRLGEDPTALKVEDTHIFSSNFYLTGLYSIVNGGFQLVPQGGFDPGVMIDRPGTSGGNFFAGWFPSSPTFTLYPPEDVVPPLDGHSFFILDQDDFIPCPNGAFLLQGNLGNPVDLGNGSSFQLFQPHTPRTEEQREADCSNFFNTGNLSHELKFGVPYREIPGNLDVIPSPPVRLGGDGGTWFYGGDALNEEPNQADDRPVAQTPTEDEQAIYLQDRVRLGDYFSLNLGVRADAFEGGEPVEPLILNPIFLNGFSTIPLDQTFGGRFRIRTTIRQSSLGQQGPGGSTATVAEAGAADPPSVLLVSLGESTGDAFTAYVTGDGPISIEGIAVLEPVAAPPAEVARFEQMMKDAGAAVATVEAYCFQFDGLVPPAGTAYRFAPPEVQKAFEPLARVLNAGQRVKDAGGLVPDTQLDTYFPAISQWAVWTREKGFDLESFGEAWLGHVKKNVEQAGERMTDELEQAVRERIPGRWRDIEKILAEADRMGEGSSR